MTVRVTKMRSLEALQTGNGSAYVDSSGTKVKVNNLVIDSDTTKIYATPDKDNIFDIGKLRRVLAPSWTLKVKRQKL